MKADKQPAVTAMPLGCMQKVACDTHGCREQQALQLCFTGLASSKSQQVHPISGRWHGHDELFMQWMQRQAATTAGPALAASLTKPGSQYWGSGSTTGFSEQALPALKSHDSIVLGCGWTCCLCCCCCRLMASTVGYPLDGRLVDVEGLLLVDPMPLLCAALVWGTLMEVVGGILLL